jgi:transposase InsO family protein
VYHEVIEWYRMNKGQHGHKLREIYEVSGISKQAHNQYMQRRQKDEQISHIVVSSILEVRSIHKSMGLKKIYNLLSPDWIGRDNFIQIGMQYGLGIKLLRSFQRTTFSTKSNWFINQTRDLEITGINQVWVSDITYFRVGEVFYYLTFIVDVYSRRILGSVASKSLHAEASCQALKQAIKSRKGENLKGLIHHSDRGSQYVSNAYLKVLSQNKIAVSMCDSVYENTHIERVNGIIKNEYLVHYSIKSYEDLKLMLRKSVNLYNKERPHWSLGVITPVEYESRLSNTAIEQRTILMLYSEPKKCYVQQSFFT